MNELLEELRSRDITLWRDGDNLRFNAPSGALSAELKSKLIAQKAELLAHLSDGANATGIIPRANRSGGVPLSFAQELLWTTDRLTPGLTAYNLPHWWRITGPLDVIALERSLQEIARRHEVLRTTFSTGENGEPAQVVHPSAMLQVRHLSVEHSSLSQLAEEEAAHVFDLVTGPLWRVTLARLGEGEYGLFITWHHIICDAWSCAILARELTALYAAFQSGQPNPLRDLPLQYADYALWQRERCMGGEMASHLAFWRERLGGDRAPLPIPADRPRPARQSHRGGMRTRDLPGALASDLRELARTEGVTLFILTLAAFKALLARSSGETDICIGSPIAQRPNVETEALIGFFLNMLALRSDLSGDPDFRELLRRVRATVLDAFQHQDVPFEKIVQELRPARHLSHQPIFQIAFVLLPSDPTVPSFAGTTVVPQAIPVTTAKFDLTLFIEETPGGMRAMMEYSADQFDPATADRMLESLELLFEGITADPSTPLSRLPIISAAQRQRILTEWSGTERPYPQDHTIAARFAECAAQSPAAIAVIEDGQRLTYADLEVRANRVAHLLQSRGIRAGDFVGLRAERSLAFVVKVLGIAKAGAAYIPLDEQEPAARLAAMKAACAFMLDAEPDADVSAEPAVSAAQADSPAYVLFTSGSTGIPKGVIVPHRGITRLVVNNDYAPFQSDDVVAFASNVCFDAATFELWGALLNGAALVITPRDVLLSPKALEVHLAQHRVTVLFLTTSLFNRLAHEAPAMFGRLRILVFGGEEADAESVRLVLAHGRPQRLVNGYGPTETTTFAICHTIEKAEGPSVPIGRPIANTRVFLLDEKRQPVPVGVAGEIYIGGPGVALGYHGMPQLTAEKFLTTPYGRLYRTGDLARWRPGGTLEYLRRIDQQLKLRGFRIEPGEIETALRQHPQIRHAAVVAHTEAGAADSLIAYLVPQTDGRAEITALREFLSQRLPAYMIPSAFVYLESLPLTPNGKLDHRALPAPAADIRPLREGAPPENPLQALLVEIWEELLNRRPIGIRDDFFELGGHSLLAARMLAMTEERLGVRPQFGVIFTNPTVEGMAVAIKDGSQQSDADQSWLLLNENGSKAPFFFLHGDYFDGGFYCRGLAQCPGGERPFYAMHPAGLHGDPVPATIEEMAALNVRDLRKIQPQGPYLLGGYCNGALVAFEMARQIEAEGGKAPVVVLLMAAGTNWRWRHLKRATGMISALRFDDAVSRQRRFLSWKERICFLKGMCRHYAKAAAHLIRQPAAEQARRILRKLKRVFQRFRGKLPVVTMRPAADADDPRHRTELREARAKAYFEAVGGYIPKPYGGRIVLLWPQEEKADVPQGPSSGWTEVCGDVHVVPVPGNHSTCVARHANARVIGEQIGRVLAEFERDSSG